MSVILHQPRVLQLSNSWEPSEVKTPQEAMTALVGDDGDYRAVHYVDGNPWEMSFAEWLALPPPDANDVWQIHTPHRAIRIPKVIVAKQLRRVRKRTPTCARLGILRRDKFTCTYTGKKAPDDVPYEELTVDHIIPLDRGGPDKDWMNMITCLREVNHRKGNRLNSECGLRLLFQPRKPKPLSPAAFIRNRYQIPEWDPLLAAFMTSDASLVVTDEEAARFLPWSGRG